MSDGSPSVYAKDYLTAAQVTALAYMASTIKVNVGDTGATLANAIAKDPTASQIFTPQELQRFVSEYKFVGLTSRGVGSSGGDAIAFQNVTTKSVVIGVAGVNDHSPVAYNELTQTNYQTEATGANGFMYADIAKFAFGLMDLYKDSKFDFAGHSAGGQMVQLLRAEVSLRGLSSRVITTMKRPGFSGGSYL